MSSYSKGAFASQLGISRSELENRAKAAGYGTTEEYYNSGKWDTAQSDLMAKQNATQQEFLNRYNTKTGGFTPLADIATRLQTEYGYQPAQELATGLTKTALGTQGMMANLPQQIQAETRGYDVNAAQRGRLQEARGSELSGRLTNEARAAESANVTAQNIANQVAQGVGYAGEERTFQMQPLQMEAAMIGDAFARQVTMYTTNLQNETTKLIAKWQQEGALKSEEAGRLATLAQQEQAYENAKKLYAYQKETDQRFKTGGTTDYTSVLEGLLAGLGGK